MAPPDPKAATAKISKRLNRYFIGVLGVERSRPDDLHASRLVVIPLGKRTTGEKERRRLHAQEALDELSNDAYNELRLRVFLLSTHGKHGVRVPDHPDLPPVPYRVWCREWLEKLLSDLRVAEQNTIEALTSGVYLRDPEGVREDRDKRSRTSRDSGAERSADAMSPVDGMAQLMDAIRPTITEQHRALAEEYIRQAQANPPQTLEQQYQFVENVNAFLDAASHRIKLEDGRLARLRVTRSGGPDKGFIQFRVAGGSAGGFKSAAIQLVPVSPAYHRTGS